MTGLFKNKEKQVQRVVLIETSLIIPNRSQPRVTFSDEELSLLPIRSGRMESSSPSMYASAA